MDKRYQWLLGRSVSLHKNWDFGSSRKSKRRLYDMKYYAWIQISLTYGVLWLYLYQYLSGHTSYTIWLLQEYVRNNFLWSYLIDLIFMTQHKIKLTDLNHETIFRGIKYN